MDSPKLIIISGLPGSGKSTLAESVARRLKVSLFSVDPIESAVIKSGIKKGFETGFAAYLVAETLASEQLKLGLSVIIDAVSPVKEARDMWHGLENKYNAHLIIVECILDNEVHKKRIEARVRNMHGIPEVSWEDVEKRRKEYLKWEEKRLIIDTSHDSELNINMTIEYITQPAD